MKVKRFSSEFIKESYSDFEWFECPIMSFIFFMPIPDSMPKFHKQLACREELRHVLRPDVDNMIKFYLDALKGVLYKDDSQISIHGSIKIYSNNPRTIIQVAESERIISRAQLKQYAILPLAM